MKKTARNNNESQQSCCFDERHEKENVQFFFRLLYSFTRWHVFSLWQVILLYWSAKKLKQMASFASNKIVITMKAVLMLGLLEYGVLYWQERWGNVCAIVKNYVWQQTWRSLTDVMLFSPCSHTSAPHCLYLHTPGVWMGSGDIHCIATVGEHTYIHTFTLLSVPKKGFSASILTLS